MTDTKPKVIVVGAGVFGLSTALHLVRRGYPDVTVLDGQEHDKQQYSPDLGSRSASADLNKIFRASYGDAVHYQDLAYEAQKVWLQWNEEIAASSIEDLPYGLSPQDKLVDLCGMLRLSQTDTLGDFEVQTLKNFTESGLREAQYVLSDPADQARIPKDSDWYKRFCVFGDPTKAESKGKVGVLDTTAGYVMMGKACLWMYHLCRRAGVKFIFGSGGRVVDFLSETSTGGVKKIIGVKTSDGAIHNADLVVVASGPYTPLLVPSTRPEATATAGSLVTIELPRSRPDLWERFAPENFPVIIWGMRKDGKRSGLYILPRSRDGLLKFGFRGVKFTNLDKPDASTPIYPEAVPSLAIDVVNDAIDEYLPELKGLPFRSTRLCWYTDGPHDNFLVDYVPGFEGLFVASCGSGHAAKHMPTLGNHIVDAIERKDTVYTKLWKWKNGGERPKNVLDLKMV